MISVAWLCLAMVRAMPPIIECNLGIIKLSSFCLFHIFEAFGTPILILVTDSDDQVRDLRIYNDIFA